MEFNPDLLIQLIDTFKVELEEQLQLITDGLLQLEKNTSEATDTECIEMIFRAGHNIKGAARSLSIHDVADIAHHIESLFAALQKKILVISPIVTDLCFEAVDKMRVAMQCFLENQPINFDLSDLLMRLDNAASEKKIPTQKKSKKKPQKTKKLEALASVSSPSASVDDTHPLPQPPAPSSVSLKKTKQETIRVSIGDLDRIAALMEEIQVNKIAIDEYNEQLNKEMRLHVNELGLLLHSLQEEIHLLRLVPITQLLQHLPRSARELANEMNKKVELTIRDGNVKMDKMVMEKLKDPIIHLLRNAIDHGIEKPSVRKALGKPEKGHITLDVSEEGNQILLRIKDDGAGINLNKIIEVAEKKNLFSSAELKAMNETERLELIFRPGFSTQEMITSISGRGVGLDVVKENIALLKGQVTITTTSGEGTSFDLRVPLTLASERGLIVRCGGQLFVIPTITIEKILLVDTTEMFDVGASQAILLNQHPIPLRALADILSLEKIEPLLHSQLHLVVIRKGTQSLALMVEAIIGEREIVVKPLPTPLNKITGIAGGTLSGTGEVMIVLNPSDIITMALRNSQISRVVLNDEEIKAPSKLHVLVVDDSITTRTLEKSILENKGYQVTIAVDGQEAWNILQKQSFNLLITDVIMPSVDGFTLTERVKKSEKLQNMPVIIVTSQDSDHEKKRGIEVGADAYIVKSEFESGVLLEIVEQLV